VPTIRDHRNQQEKNEKEFRSLTFSMEIPKERREPTQVNLRWFLRNGFVENQNHPNYDLVVSLALRMLRDNGSNAF
jgi:hypothetical protein